MRSGSTGSKEDFEMNQKKSLANKRFWAIFVMIELGYLLGCIRQNLPKGLGGIVIVAGVIALLCLIGDWWLDRIHQNSHDGNKR